MRILELQDVNQNVKEFIFSNLSKTEQLTKLHIISLEKLKTKEKSTLYYQNKPSYTELEITLPEFHIYTIIIDVDKLYTDIVDFNVKDIYQNYIKDLSKFIRIIQEIESKLHELQFYMIDRYLSIISTIKSYLRYYQDSYLIMSNQFESSEIIDGLIITVNQRIDKLNSDVLMKGTYIDIKTSRILTIISLITFPILMMATWFGANFPKSQMIFLNSKHSYKITIIVCIIFIISMFSIFWNDIYAIIF